MRLYPSTVPLHVETYPSRAPSAPTVLLLHGLGSCGEDWGLQVPALVPHYQLLAPDLRGNGGTPMPPGWPSIPDLAADVRHMLEARTSEPAHVVGLSLGGAVALQLAVDIPGRIRSLTLVNTFARLRSTSGSLRRGLARSWLAATGNMDELGRRVAEGLFPEPGQEGFRRAAAVRLASNVPRSYFKLLAAVVRFDLRRRLGDIRLPTLVVAGDLDTTVPMVCKLELAERIPGARLEVVQGSRHVTPLDATPRFNALLLSFLREVDGQEGPRP